MKVWVDSSTGSNELMIPLRQVGLDPELTQLKKQGGDFAFEGNGPEGRCLVGVERKVIGGSTDLLDSIRTHRINEQLDKMDKTYDFGFLVVEGQYSSDRMGRLQTTGKFGKPKLMPGGFTEDSLNKALLTLVLDSMSGKLHMKETRTKHQTALFIASLVRWFNDKTWEQHRSHLQAYQREYFVKLSDFVSMALVLPGVGLGAAKAIEKHFAGNFDKFLRTGPVQLSEVMVSTPAGPRRFGMSKATAVVDRLTKLRGV